ncbi:MAG: methyltransferase [Pseudomonadota bacterium]
MTETTEDAVLGGRLRLRQPATGYRAAIDPFLLAAAVEACPGDRVLDLGCGVGTAGLALLTRHPGCHVVGLELVEGHANLAGVNAVLNGLSGRFEPVVGDVAQSPFRGAVFDQVICNPPFHGAERGRPAAAPTKALATREDLAGLAQWLRSALHHLRPRGWITLIHRADRLDEVLALLRVGSGQLRITPLWPARGKPAKRVIVSARKGVAGPLTLGAGLVLHEANGHFTSRADAILRGGGALEP